MNATLSADGKIVIPKELRECAQLQPGDTLDIRLYKGTLLLRKHQPLSSEQAAALLERSWSQPKPTPEDDAAVEQAIRASEVLETARSRKMNPGWLKKLREQYSDAVCRETLELNESFPVATE